MKICFVPTNLLFLAVVVVSTREIEDCELRFKDNQVCACSSHDTFRPLSCHNGSKTTVIQPCSCVYYDPALNITVVGNCFFSSGQKD